MFIIFAGKSLLTNTLYVVKQTYALLYFLWLVCNTPRYVIRI